MKKTTTQGHFAPFCSSFSKKLYLSTLVLLLTQNISLAQGIPTHITITPYRSAVPIKESGSSITVISAEEIKKKKYNSVIEILRAAPGISTAQAGGAGKASSLFLRGADSDQTLVLIDGIRANDNNVGSFDFADLKTENIERIEIIRGAQSVLYGSEAMGGVINIISKKPEKKGKASAKIEAGSYGTHYESLTLEGGNQFAQESLSLSLLNSDGISAANSKNGNSENDAYKSFTLASSSQIQVLENGSMDLGLRYGKHQTELDGFSFVDGAIDDKNFEQERENLSLSNRISKPIAENIRASLELGAYKENLDGKDPDSPFNNYDIKSDTFLSTPKVEIEMSQAHSSVLGYTFENRQGENREIFDEERNTNSYFAEHSYAHEKNLFLTLGARRDNDSEFGEENTYRSTIAKLFDNDSKRLHASFGSGFKAPSLNELYFPFFGNPELSPEKSTSYDFGIEQVFLNERARFDISLFYNDFKDLIAFDTQSFRAENIEEASARGIENSLSFELSENLSLNSSYTYTDSENKTTGELLPRRPRHQASFALFFEQENLSAVLSTLIVNSRRESTGDKMDNYEKVDLSLSYALNKELSPYLRFENLFDEDYEEIVGFGTAGFSVYAGLEVKL